MRGFANGFSAVLVCGALSAQAGWQFLDTHDRIVTNAVCRGEKGPCVKFGKNNNWGYVRGGGNGGIRFEHALFEDIVGSAVEVLGIDGDVVFADCVFRRTTGTTVALRPDYRSAVERGAKPTGRLVFERCRFEGYADVPFFSAEPYPMFDVTLRDCAFVRTGKRPGSTTTCAVPAIELGSWYDFGTADLPDALKGCFEIEGLKADGERNLVGVRDELGYTDFKGLFKGVDFSYSAPDRGLPRLTRVRTSDLAPRPSSLIPHPSSLILTWNGSYAVKPPQYTYYFHAKAGNKVSFVLAYPDGGGAKTRYEGLSLKLMVPSGEERDLGPIGPGRNEFSVTAEADGWYRFSNPKQAIVPIEARLVEFKGAALAYQADTENYSLAKFLLADEAKPATGYFEVPAGTKDFRIAVLWGDLEIRNPKGEVVAAIGAGDYRGRHVFDLKATSSESEVWSFTAKGPGTHVIRFHAPLTGIWADTPEALPRLLRR